MISRILKRIWADTKNKLKYIPIIIASLLCYYAVAFIIQKYEALIQSILELIFVFLIIVGIPGLWAAKLAAYFIEVYKSCQDSA